MQNPADSDPAGLGDDRLDQLCVALASQGYCVLDQALPPALALALQEQAQALPRAAFHVAGTGREDQHQVDRRVRSDRISWLERKGTAVIAYLDFAETLREALNRRLFLGLFDYECHFACYDPGAFYGLHRDAFAGERNRIVSTVLYLNSDWQEDCGGELLLYDEQGQVLQRVQPLLNRLVLFLSEGFPHEVRPALRCRYSIAGWYRVNASRATRVDPPR